jgi:hypothetical protein
VSILPTKDRADVMTLSEKNIGTRFGTGLYRELHD